MKIAWGPPFTGANGDVRAAIGHSEGANGKHSHPQQLQRTAASVHEHEVGQCERVRAIGVSLCRSPVFALYTNSRMWILG